MQLDLGIIVNVVCIVLAALVVGYHVRQLRKWRRDRAELQQKIESFSISLTVATRDDC